jgi:hypothetical protein
MEPNNFEKRLRPRLPDDPDYWSSLADRIVESADTTLQGYRIPEPWWNTFVAFGPRVGMAAAAAAALILWAAPDDAPVDIPVEPFQYAFSPPDPLARQFMISDSAPDISTLLRLQREGTR